MTLRSLLVRLKDAIRPEHLLMLTLAGVINAFGVIVFLSPVRLYDSGMSVFLLLLNVPLFLYGLKKQGAAFTARAIYAVAVYAAAAWLITDVLPLDVTVASPVAGTDLLLCAVFGGMISGAGSGLAIRFGGAMDGVEVMAVVFARRLGITVGTFVMVYNVLLYVFCGAVLRSWILPLYSILAYASALKTVDYIVEGFDRAKCAIIVTIKPDEICRALAELRSLGRSGQREEFLALCARLEVMTAHLAEMERPRWYNIL